MYEEDLVYSIDHHLLTLIQHVRGGGPSVLSRALLTHSLNMYQETDFVYSVDHHSLNMYEEEDFVYSIDHHLSLTHPLELTHSLA